MSELAIVVYIGMTKKLLPKHGIHKTQAITLMFSTHTYVHEAKVKVYVIE